MTTQGLEIKRGPRRDARGPFRKGMSFMEIPSPLQILRLTGRASGGTRCAYSSQPSPAGGAPRLVPRNEEGDGSPGAPFSVAPRSSIVAVRVNRGPSLVSRSDAIAAAIVADILAREKREVSRAPSRRMPRCGDARWTGGVTKDQFPCIGVEWTDPPYATSIQAACNAVKTRMRHSFSQRCQQGERLLRQLFCALHQRCRSLQRLRHHRSARSSVISRS
jgi:hypothetical protein